MDLKEALEQLKSDPDESCANVLRRLVTRKTPVETTDELVSLAISRQAYLLLIAWLPDNLKEILRAGVR
jgi:hypothetical protein